MSIRPTVYLCVTISPPFIRHFFPFLCLNVSLSLYLHLRIDLARLSLRRHSQPFGPLLLGKVKEQRSWREGVKDGGFCLWDAGTFKWRRRSRVREIKPTSDEREINFRGTRIWKKVSGPPALTIKQIRPDKMIVVLGTAGRKRSTTANFEWSRSLRDGEALSNNSVHGSRADARRPSRTFPSFTQQLSATLLVNWKRDKNPLWI